MVMICNICKSFGFVLSCQFLFLCQTVAVFVLFLLRSRLENDLFSPSSPLPAVVSHCTTSLWESSHNVIPASGH